MITKFNINQITHLLRESGIKATAQRIAVCQYVLNEADHPSAEKVKSAVDTFFPKISLATVYNTLNTLVEANLLQAIKTPQGDKVVFDRNTTHHYHFIDQRDGHMVDIQPDALRISHDLPETYSIASIDVFLSGELEE